VVGYVQGVKLADKESRELKFDPFRAFLYNQLIVAFGLFRPEQRTISFELSSPDEIDFIFYPGAY